MSCEYNHILTRSEVYVSEFLSHWNCTSHLLTEHSVVDIIYYNFNKSWLTCMSSVAPSTWTQMRVESLGKQRWAVRDGLATPQRPGGHPFEDIVVLQRRAARVVDETNEWRSTLGNAKREPLGWLWWGFMIGWKGKGLVQDKEFTRECLGISLLSSRG